MRFILYFLCFQYIIYFITFILFLFKNIAHINLRCLIPVVGIYGTCKWFFISYRYKKINKKDIQEKILDEDENKLYYDKLSYIVKILSYNMFDNIRRFYTATNMFSTYCKYLTQCDNILLGDTSKTFVAITSKYIQNKQYVKISDLYLNMIDTLYEILIVANAKMADMLTEDIHILLINYNDTLDVLINKEYELVKQEMERKSDQYEKYMKIKIKNINDTLKSVQKDYSKLNIPVVKDK